MEREYSVYCHTFPNGKRYVGISSDCEKRWRNGKGYETQQKMANTPIALLGNVWYHFIIPVEYAYSTKNRHRKLK